MLFPLPCVITCWWIAKNLIVILYYLWRDLLYEGRTITFQVFFVAISNLIFSWSKNSYKYLGNILYLQFEDIWNYICFLYLITSFVLDLNLVKCFAILFHTLLPIALSEVIREFWTAKFSSLFSIIVLLFLQSLPLFTILYLDFLKSPRHTRTDTD